MIDIQNGAQCGATRTHKLTFSVELSSIAGLCSLCIVIYIVSRCVAHVCRSALECGLTRYILRSSLAQTLNLRLQEL